MSNEEINKFKEELLQMVNQLERKITEDINSKKAQLNYNYEKNEEKINQIISHNREIIESVVAEKINCEKIQSLEKFKNKADQILITHEIRINKNNKEIDDVKTKYDKVIKDNLYAPGFVGPTCQFKNIGEYIIHNISEFSRIKYEKDNLKKETKEIKQKVEGIFKKMMILVDNSVEKFKEYTDKQIEQFSKQFNVKYEEFEKKSHLVSHEIDQTKLDIEKQVDTLKFENQKLLLMIDNLKKNEENIGKINNKIANIKEKIKNLEKILKSDNFKNSLLEGKSKSKKKPIKEKDIDNIKEFDTSIEKIKRKRNSLLIENKVKNSFLMRSPKKRSSNKNRKGERRSSIREKDIKDLSLFGKEIQNDKKNEILSEYDLKQIKIINSEKNEIKEERKNDNDNNNKINNNFSNVIIDKENEISLLKLKSVEINNNNFRNNILGDKPKDDFKIMKNEINFDIKENGKVSKIIEEKQADSQSFKSEESSFSKTSINQSKSESLNNKENKIEKEIIQNYILDNKDNKSKSNKFLNINNNKENDVNNTQKNIKNNNEFEINSFMLKKIINNKKKEEQKMFPIISVPNKMNIHKSSNSIKQNILNNISRNINSNNNSINNISSNKTSKRNSMNNKSNKTLNMISYNQKNEDKTLNLINEFNSKKIHKKYDLIQINRTQKEINNNKQNRPSPTLLNLGVNFVGLNADNSDEDDDSDDVKKPLSGTKLNKLRLEGFGISTPNSQKVTSKKIKNKGIITEAPLKISAAFGRTAYTFFDKNNDQNRTYSIKTNTKKKINENLDLVLAPKHKVKNKNKLVI